MDIKKIDDTFSVATQITVSELNAIKSMGFKTIICNRFDNEETWQPPVKNIQEEAKRLGLDFAFIPVGSGRFDEQAIEQSRSVLKTSPSPILAYCRTGTRCIILWALANVNNFDRETRIKMTQDAGYDLRHIIEV